MIQDQVKQIQVNIIYKSMAHSLEISGMILIVPSQHLLCKASQCVLLRFAPHPICFLTITELPA